MANYSGTYEEQRAKANAYAQRPAQLERAKRHRDTPEYKQIMKIASKKFRSTEEYRAKARAYKHQQAYKDKRRDSLLRKNFGIGLEQYKRMMADQNGGCAICGQLEEVRQLAVDHSHKTGAIRGLLCRRCNVAIGLMEDNMGLLSSAIDYLKRAPAQNDIL